MEEIRENIFVESQPDAADAEECLHIRLEPGRETAGLGLGLEGLSGRGYEGAFGLVFQNNDSRKRRITIDGLGRTLQLGGEGFKGPLALITVGAGITLTLRNITLKGFRSNELPLVRVSGGTLILETGAVLRDNGKGITVGTSGWGTGGTLLMRGGLISGNASGGVTVGRDGLFIMSGGSISDNSSGAGSHGGGGAHIHSGGSFRMEGGEIKGNTAWGFDQSGNGGGVYIRSGGMFEMSGGEIRGNTASGDFGSWGMGGPAYGGGVYAEKARALARDTVGGLVEDRGASFVKTGGIIYGWDAGDGLGNNTTSGLGNTIYVHSDPVRQYERTAGLADILDSDSGEGWEE